MPVIKSAIKKLRKDRKRTIENDAFRNNLEKVVRAAKKTRSKRDVSLAFSVIDKAVKKHIIHANKGKRMKSSLSKSSASKVATKKPSKAAVKPKTKTAIKKKTATKKSA